MARALLRTNTMNEAEKAELQRDLDTAQAIVMLQVEKGLLDGIQEACDALLRELGVRERCYPKWLQAGKLSRTEARDRMDRLSNACRLIQGIKDAAAKLPDCDVTSSGDMTDSTPF